MLHEEWIEALRSGEYQQGRRYLKKGDNYCCLGVLCELADEPEEVKGVYTLFGDKLSFPSPELLHKVGLEIKMAKRLTELNDFGVSFGAIADELEEYYAKG